MYAFTGEKALEMMEGGSVFGVIVIDENLQDAGGVLMNISIINDFKRLNLIIV